MIALAAGSAALACLFCWPTRISERSIRPFALWSRGSVWLAVTLIGLGMVTRLSGQRLVLGLVVLGLGWSVLTILRRAREAKAASAFAGRVLEACEAMAADLAVGQPHQMVLERVAERWPPFAPVAMAGQVGADIPEAMRELANQRGGAALRRIAATWQVASATGSGLADALEIAAEGIRNQRRITRLIETELAGAKATSKLLAILPLGVLLMGQGIGGEPFDFLLQTSVGLGCLSVGAGLTVAGIFWLDAIAMNVLEQ
ncbi:MAG TPA: hypothetical protein P5108_04960 [Marmoricola sp.]|jgi:tight adherence protein B|nr:hypothetical protein [Nocardioidaceae bacterium]MCB8992386.1 hypothetical protein [Nocardioidaceae bacterium]MCO5323175.1 hypothetical protein [Nocardioidaceae bacterium]HMY09960.1 hypothetical protein [Marmoricola sp.]HRV68782.1 hypothetical protein [Marmoricola sp.]